MRPSPHAETILDPSALRAQPLPLDEQSDKVARGTVLVVGGSVATPGAALLAGVAALRVGAGRLQIATATAVTSALAIAVPEALVTSYEDEPGMPSLELLVGAADAVVVGPGLGDLERAVELLAVVLDTVQPGTPVIIDALAIDAFASTSERHDDGGCLVITPNRDELARLLNGSPARGAAEQVVATERGVTVVSFGRVATPDGRTWLDPDPVTGLGTSGAGDVLAGAIGGLAARTHDVVVAACWATVCHRVAANRLADAMAPVGYLARELVDELPLALAELQHGG